MTLWLLRFLLDLRHVSVIGILSPCHELHRNISCAGTCDTELWQPSTEFHVPNVSPSFPMLSPVKSSSDRPYWATSFFPAAAGCSVEWRCCNMCNPLLCQVCKLWLLLSWVWSSPCPTLLTHTRRRAWPGGIWDSTSAKTQPPAETEALGFLWGCSTLLFLCGHKATLLRLRSYC